MNSTGRTAAICVLLSGAATIASVLLMRSMTGGEIRPYSYPNEPGFKSAMLWLELAKSPEEVFQVLGPSGTTDGKAIRENLTQGNDFDYPFLVCYSIFNASLIVFVTRLNAYRFTGLIKLKTFMVLGLILAGAMLVGDLVQNVAIADLAQVKTEQDVSPTTMQELIYWTRIKWVSIFLVCLMCSAGYTAYFRRIPPLLLPTGYAIAGISGFIALFLPDARSIIGWITLPHLAVVWSASMVHAAIFLFYGPHPSLRPPQAVVAGEEDASVALE